MVKGGMSCVKYALFVFNFLFVICAIALIAIGGIAVNNKELSVFAASNYNTGAAVLIGVGVIIFFIAFLGCCGAVKENNCMVTMFGIILLIIFIAQLVLGITAYVKRGSVDDMLKNSMNETIRERKKVAMDVWDDMQTEWHCCGIEGPQDYTFNDLSPRQSCCDPKVLPPCTVKDAYKKGCYQKFSDMVKGKIATIGGVAIGIAVVELIGVIFAFCLSAAIKKEYEGV